MSEPYMDLRTDQVPFRDVMGRYVRQKALEQVLEREAQLVARGSVSWVLPSGYTAHVDLTPKVPEIEGESC